MRISYAPSNGVLFLTAAFLLSRVSSFALSKQPTSFVKDVLVPWHDRAHVLFHEDLGSHENLETKSHYPGWGKAAEAYERVFGIPPRFFDRWFVEVVRKCEREDDWEAFDRDCTALLVPWTRSFDATSCDLVAAYLRVAQRRLRSHKEEILKTIEESTYLELPVELEFVRRNELLDSNQHDATFQSAMARMIQEERKTIPQLVFDLELDDGDGDIYFSCVKDPRVDRDSVSKAQALTSLRACIDNSEAWWFVSLGELRTQAHFPSALEKNLLEGKNLKLRNALCEIFDGGTEYYQATQTHLVRHAEEYNADLDSILELFELSGRLFPRNSANEFLTEGAIELNPKELLLQEHEAILDEPFQGLEGLQDTPRVKVLRTERDAASAKQMLNITNNWLHSSALAIVPWGASKAVAVLLRNPKRQAVAVAEFTSGSYRNGGHTVKLSKEATVTMLLQNGCPLKKESTRCSLDDGLVALCAQYHHEFLHGWRLEHLETENPEWWQRRKGQQ